MQSTKVVPTNTAENNPAGYHPKEVNDLTDEMNIENNQYQQDSDNNETDAVPAELHSTDTMSMNTDKLETTLEEAGVASRKLRFRITLFTTGLGFALLVTLLIINLIAPNEFLLGLGTICSVLMLLGVMHDDIVLIRVMSLITPLLTIPLIVQRAIAGYKVWFVDRLDGEREIIDGVVCHPDLHEIGCEISASDANFASDFMQIGMTNNTINYFTFSIESIHKPHFVACDGPLYNQWNSQQRAIAGYKVWFVDRLDGEREIIDGVVCHPDLHEIGMTNNTINYFTFSIESIHKPHFVACDGPLLTIPLIVQRAIAGYKVWFVDRLDGEREIIDGVVCHPDLHEIGCEISASDALWAAVNNSIWLLIVPNLFLVRGAKVYDRRKRNGRRFQDCAFKIPAHLALERIWFIGRVQLACGSIRTFITSLLFVWFREQMQTYDQLDFAPHLFSAGVKITLVVLATQRNRDRVYAFLAAITTSGEVRSASSVAALLGNVNAADGLTLARDKFRSITFSELCEKDFAGNKESAAETNNLYAKTTETRLGDCDAFLSHSWSDSGVEKFQALERWAEDFKQRKNRWPRIWLDKACINQKDIASDLLCLPVFLAGCKTLLIIPGPTYTSRLWCVMEVFVFLKTGGSTQRITVLPIGMADDAAENNMFAKTDVRKCECYLDTDKQKILRIIKKGFGSYDAFNQNVRRMFKERLTVFRRETTQKLSQKQITKLVADMKLLRAQNTNLNDIVSSLREEAVAAKDDVALAKVVRVTHFIFYVQQTFFVQRDQQYVRFVFCCSYFCFQHFFRRKFLELKKTRGR